MKYSDKDLNKLANEAKKNLLDNVNKAVKDKKDVNDIKKGNIPNKNNPQGDIYSEFKTEENDGTVNTGSQQKQYNLQNKPKDIDTENQTLNPTPSEDDLEDNPVLEEYEEPIFQGGPTQGQVLMWKKQWANYDIYATEVSNKTFIFRTINRFEYKQLIALNNIDATCREEIICETCVLWPLKYNWRAMAMDKAGLPSTISKIIMQKSGFTQEYKVQVI